MEMLQKDYGVKEVFFFDDSMGADKKRLEAICDEILGRKLDIKWTTPNGIAHWTLDENLLLKMKRAGCYRITFGIESGNPDIRRYIGKSYSLDQARRLIKFANKIGLWTICTFIIGFPPETRQQIEETVAFAINSETDLAIFYLLCPHPGTKVYDDFKNLGLLDLDYLFSPYVVRKPEDWAMAGRVLAGRGVPTKHFTIEELQEIVSRAYNQFFKKRLLSFILNPQKLIYKIHSYEDMKYMFKNGYYGSGLILKQLLTKSFYSQNLRNNSKN